jgi:hypothetical protein
MENVEVLLAVREYMLARGVNATLPFGLESKKLVERMEK